MRLKEIEKRILEIKQEKPRRIHNLQQNPTFTYKDDIEYMDIEYLDIEKAQLEKQRQFILDSRDSWKAKLLWNVLLPIIISLLTSYFYIKIK